MKVFSKSLFAAFLVAFTLGLHTPATAQRTAGNIDLTIAAESTVHSVVYIQVTSHQRVQGIQQFNSPFDLFGDLFGGGGGMQQQQPQTRKQQASGSGVIISRDGYIVTNNHVVEGAEELTVKLNNKQEYKARIIGLDKNTDLALIKIEGNDFPAIPIGSSEALKLGEWVLAVGNPFNLTSTVTAGIVSAKSRSLTGGIESFIQTDAAINRGNSGGALVNSRGELVGINTMIYSQTGSYTGYGFAIPTTIMNKVVEDLKKYGTVQRALIGIVGSDVSTYIDEQRSKDKEVNLGVYEGVYVREVTSDGAANEAGLREGDIITAINGKKVEGMAQLQEIIAAHRPGDQIQVAYLRDKSTKQTRLTLRNTQGTTSILEEVDLEGLGIGLKALSAETKKQLNLSHGLEVTAVRDGKMKQAGVTKGLILLQINDRKMTTVDDFEEVVKATNLSSDRTLWIRAITQSGLKRSYTIELDQKKK